MIETARARSSIYGGPDRLNLSSFAGYLTSTIRGRQAGQWGSNSRTIFYTRLSYKEFIALRFTL
jgi:hypothetical protein